MKNKEYTITIFTPTYNRGYILMNLYQSLLQQTKKDFYWLIVDDGSSDNTKDMVKEWMVDNKIKIEYFYIENAGKAAAMNFALGVASGKLFFCVDSDDYLSDDAIEKILRCYTDLNSSYVGILAGRKNYRTNEVITKFKGRRHSGKLRELYNKREISGDTALIYKTSLIKKYRFPVFENEKFIPESYLYDLLDKEGELYLLEEYIYMGDYLKDGYTGKIKEIIFKNPNGYYAYIAQRLQLENDFLHIFFDNIRCVSINMVRKQKNILIGTRQKWLMFLVLPLAVIYYLKTFHWYEKE